MGRLAILAATTVLAHQIPHFRSTIPKVLLLLKKLVDDFRLEILANDVMELVVTNSFKELSPDADFRASIKHFRTSA